MTLIFDKVAASLWFNKGRREALARRASAFDPPAGQAAVKREGSLRLMRFGACFLGRSISGCP